MTRPLPGQPEPVPFGRRINEMHAALTDDEGYFRGREFGVLHEIDDEVPDNAHWKGWVW
jgi:hypothetical protein